jgi:membrane associated rhomboid family serine protease
LHIADNVFPYHDENKTQRAALMTWALVAANIIVWVMVQGAGMSTQLPRSVCELGLIPGELTGSVPAGTPVELGEGARCVVGGGAQYSRVLTSMFLHGSWLHLLGNMWFLFLFGNNVEDSMGRLRFLVFYLLSGVAAALVQVTFDPSSAVPMVGASGAISGVMGGYLVLYPRVRVFTLVPLGFFITTMALPAWTMLIYWLVLQVLGSVTVVPGAKGGVAFWAHIGGFVAGAILVKLFASRELVARHRAGLYRPTDLRRAA